MEFEEDIENIATSLEKEFGGGFCREDILAEFLNEFEEEYFKLIKNKEEITQK